MGLYSYTFHDHFLRVISRSLESSLEQSAYEYVFAHEMVLCLAWPSLNSADGNVSTGTLTLFELLPSPPIIMAPVEVSGDKS